MGFISHLECSNCKETLDAAQIHSICPKCKSGPLLVRYDLPKAAPAFAAAMQGKETGVWRYRHLLPVQKAKNIVTLGEGGTPLIKLHTIGKKLGLKHLYLKDEGLNPTGTFKARGASVFMSMLKEFGIGNLGIPSSGNAGSAFALYSARAGIKAHVAIPAGAPESTKKQCLTAGAQVSLIQGGFPQAAEFISKGVAEHGWFDASTFKESWRAEGKKTMGFEIWEQFQNETPEVVLYPTGGGVGFVAIWKAYQELEQMNLLKGKKSRMYSVQSTGLSRLKKAFDAGKKDTEPWAKITAAIPGLSGPAKSPGDVLVLQILRESGGAALDIEDEEAFSDMQYLAAMEGVFICPEGAATLSALRNALKQGIIGKDERVVLLNTGSGLKYLEFMKS